VQDQCGITAEFDSTKDSLFPDNPFICRTPSNAVIDMQGCDPDLLHIAIQYTRGYEDFVGLGLKMEWGYGRGHPLPIWQGSEEG